MEKIDDKILNEISQRLIAELHPEKIYLFGSYAWGNPSKESDIDLMIIIKDNKTSLTKMVRRAFKGLNGMGISKDIIIRTEEDFNKYNKVVASLEHKVLMEGRLLYG